jgi:hypothetical protein
MGARIGGYTVMVVVLNDTDHKNFLTMSIRGKNMERKLKLGVASMGVGLLLGASFANAEIALSPQGVQYGSFVLVPVVKATAGHDDNVYRLSSNEVASSYLEVSPKLALVAQERNNSYQLAYSANARSYSNDSDDSYLDQAVNATAHVEPNARLRLDGSLAYQMGHDERGSGRSSGQGLAYILAMGEVDKFDVTSVDAGLEYGAKDARGLFFLKADMDQKRYDRAIVAAGRDNDSLKTELGFNFRLFPKTKLGLEYERVDTNYKGATLDTLDDRFFGTLTWENAAMTTGKLRLGDSEREVSGGATKSNFAWDVTGIWAPREMDKVSLMASERVSDSDVSGQSAQITQYALTWQHEWSDRVNSRLSYSKTDEDFFNALGTVVRNDDADTFGLNLNYQMRRWLVWTVGVTAKDQGSSVAGFDFKRNAYTLGAQVSL